MKPVESGREPAVVVRLPDLELWPRAFNDHGVEHRLIGGYALAAHGHLRATTTGIDVADAFMVDILLNANGRTFKKLRQFAQTVELNGRLSDQAGTSSHGAVLVVAGTAAGIGAAAAAAASRG